MKAYARKPLGMPKKNIASNSMNDYWYDDEEDDLDEFENYLGEEYDDYSDSDEYYYGHSDDELTSEEEETSEEDEDEDEDDDYYWDSTFNLGDDLWDKERHYGHHNPHAQYFDLANQGAPPTPSPTPAPTPTPSPTPSPGSDSEDSPDESEGSVDESPSDDEETDSSSEEAANAYGRRRHRRRPAHGATH